MNCDLDALINRLPGLCFRFRLDRDLTAEFVSEGVFELTGYPAADFREHRRAFGDLIHPQDKDQLWGAVQTAVSTRHPVSLRLRLRATREEKWILFHAGVEFDAQGAARALEGIALDVPHQNQAGQTLSQDEQMFRIAFEHAPTGMSLIAQDGVTYLAVNPLLCQMFGYTKEEFLGRSIRLVTHPDDEARSLEWIRKKLNDEPCEVDLEKRYLHKDGHVVWGQVRAQWIRNTDGSRRMAIAHILDITARKEAEARIRQLNRVYAVLSDINQTLIRNRDPHDMLQAACRIAVEKGSFRMAWAGLVGPESRTFAPVASAGAVAGYLDLPDPAAPADGLTARAFTSGSRALCEDLQNDPSFGDRREAALQRGYRGAAAFPLMVKGTAVGTFSLYTAEPNCFNDEELKLLDELSSDLSFALELHAREAERLRAEEALRQAEQQLRQSQKLEAFGQLAGGVAHDFNNIIAAILMQVELTATTEGLATPAVEGLNTIHAAAERAANLTRQLLLFSRRQAMQPRELDLNETVSSLAKMLERIIREDVHLELSLHPAPLWVQADAGMLDQVLLNLAVNARDAMPQGGLLLIKTAYKEFDAAAACVHPDAAPGRYVWLSVSDTGCGIPAEILPRIFEPFFTTKGPGQGSGLGLATVFGIVKQHRGWLQVSSQPGKGTSFHVYLPAISPTTAAQPPPSPPLPSPVVGRGIILLVEDDAQVRSLTRRRLERTGYTALEAAGCPEALNLWLAHSDQIGLLVTDLVMPGGISGQELARRLRQDRPQLRVLYTSGYSAELAGQELELHPGERFLQKPFNSQQLLEAVRQCLE